MTPTRNRSLACAAIGIRVDDTDIALDRALQSRQWTQRATWAMAERLLNRMGYTHCRIAGRHEHGWSVVAYEPRWGDEVRLWVGADLVVRETVDDGQGRLF